MPPPNRPRTHEMKGKVWCEHTVYVPVCGWYYWKQGRYAKKGTKKCRYCGAPRPSVKRKEK